MDMSNENVSYCLQQLAGFESSDIECDYFEIAVNDDQFTTMSIVDLADRGHKSIEKLMNRVKTLEFMIEHGLGWSDMKGGNIEDVQ